MSKTCPNPCGLSTWFIYGITGVDHLNWHLSSALGSSYPHDLGISAVLITILARHDGDIDLAQAQSTTFLSKFAPQAYLCIIFAYCIIVFVPFFHFVGSSLRSTPSGTTFAQPQELHHIELICTASGTALHRVNFLWLRCRVRVVTILR